MTLLQYVDDLLLAGGTQQDCLEGLEKLHCALANKAQLCQKEVTYLGYKIKGGHRWLTKARNRTVTQIPVPTTARQVESSSELLVSVDSGYWDSPPWWPPFIH